MLGIAGGGGLPSAGCWHFRVSISAGKVRKFLAKNNVKVTPGVGVGTGMSAEDIAAKVKPATVCIICTEREK